MNTRHQDFAAYIQERLDELKRDLIKECERVAVNREMHLKLQVEKVHRENEKLRQKAASNDSQAPPVRIEAAASNDNSSKEGHRKDDSTRAPETEGNTEQNGQVDQEEGALVSCQQTNGLEVTANSTQAPIASGYTSESIEEGPPKQAAVNTTTCCIDTRIAQLPIGTSDDLTKSPQPVSSSAAKDATSIRSPADDTLVSTPQKERSDKQEFEKQEHESYHLWSEWQATQEEQELQEHFVADAIKQAEEREKSLATQIQGKKDLDSPDKSPCTISPNSSTAMTWEFFGIPVLFYDLVTLPLQVFWTENNDDDTSPISWIIILYWTADIIARLFVIGFVTRTDDLVLKRRTIMIHYLKSSFLFDAMLVVPDWISLSFDMPRNFALLRVFRTMRFMRLMRMSKFRRTVRKLQDVFDSEYFSIYINAGWSILSILSCCHYIACFWYWVGLFDIRGYPNWLEDYPFLDNYDWEFQYLTSLHWALCQFTPGSMRVQPTNIPERVVSIIVLVWGMIFFSLFVSSLTQERMRMQSLTMKMDRDNWTLRRYLKQHKVSRGLSMRAVKYVDACVAPMMLRVQRRDVNLLDCLSHPLQLEIQAEIYFHTLLAHPFLSILRTKNSNMASKLFSSVVLEVSLAQNDNLFDTGQVSHEMFFVSQGCVGYQNADSKDFTSLYEGGWFCEQVIWVPWVHKGTSRAASESHLLSVDSAKFRNEVLEYRERSFVRECAQTYLEDLNSLLASGTMIDDIIYMDRHNLDFAKICQSEGQPNSAYGEQTPRTARARAAS